MKLPKSRIIRLSGAFAAVRQRGKTTVSSTMLVGVRRRDEESPRPARFGFVTPKYVGGAVHRNLVRRRMKNVVVELGGFVADGFDVVLVARRPASTADFVRLRRDFFAAARKGGLIAREVAYPRQVFPGQGGGE